MKMKKINIDELLKMKVDPEIYKRLPRINRWVLEAIEEIRSDQKDN